MKIKDNLLVKLSMRGFFLVEKLQFVAIVDVLWDKTD